MRATSAIGRQLEVLFFALCGLSFWVVLVVLVYLLGGLVMGSRVHAQPSSAPSSSRPADQATTASWSKCCTQPAGLTCP